MESPKTNQEWKTPSLNPLDGKTKPILVVKRGKKDKNSIYNDIYKEDQSDLKTPSLAPMSGTTKPVLKTRKSKNHIGSPLKNPNKIGPIQKANDVSDKVSNLNNQSEN